MQDEVLQIKNLRTMIHTSQKSFPVVDDVSFSLKAGETFALLGESGCGKSMTALSIIRLLPSAARINQGEIFLKSGDLLQFPEQDMRHVRGSRIAMIFQEPQTSLNPVLTIGDQIGESVQCHQGLKGQALKNEIISLLNDVGIPDPERRMNEYPHQLSGGMKQRIMISIALAGHPDILIADEPTTALDVTIQLQVLELLKQLQQDRGMAILLITHDLGVVAQVADRVAVMYAGQIVEETDTKTFVQNPQHPYSQKLFAAIPNRDHKEKMLAAIPGSVPEAGTVFSGCRFENRCEQKLELCSRKLPILFENKFDHSIRCHLYSEKKPVKVKKEPEDIKVSIETEKYKTEQIELLKVKDLKMHFPIHSGLLKRISGYVKAVDGVSFELAQGRTLALVGESGCGKTTVGKSLLRLLEPTSGKVYFEQDELLGLSKSDLRKKRQDMQIIFQDPYSSMNPRMTVEQIVEEGLVSMGILQDKKARREKVKTLLEQAGLSHRSMKKYPHEFSGGQRQRICIARALSVSPRLVVCDEPTSALDVSVQAQILNLLQQLQKDLGLSYLFITHNLSVVEYLAHDVAVMYLGRIVEYGSVEDVIQNPAHPYTQALLSSVPVIDTEKQREVIRLEGELPSPANPPSGCHFHPRCSKVSDQCRQEYPASVLLNEHHKAACWHIS